MNENLFNVLVEECPGMTLATFKRICDRATPTTFPESDPVIVYLLGQGRWIHAIKRYRALTGAGLKEAKDVIYRLRDDIPAMFPSDISPLT